MQKAFSDIPHGKKEKRKKKWNERPLTVGLAKADTVD